MGGVALADLKAEFGKKKRLTPSDIAPYICKSPSAQASMRTRKQFPIAQKDMGGRIFVTIYPLARFVGEDGARQQVSSTSHQQLGTPNMCDALMVFLLCTPLLGGLLMLLSEHLSADNAQKSRRNGGCER